MNQETRERSAESNLLEQMRSEREAVREAMIARTAYWYNAVTCQEESLRGIIESELAQADDEYERTLDALSLRAYAAGKASMPCLRTSWGKGAGTATGLSCLDLREREPDIITELCPPCESRITAAPGIRADGREEESEK